MDNSDTYYPFRITESGSLMKNGKKVTEKWMTPWELQQMQSRRYKEMGLPQKEMLERKSTQKYNFHADIVGGEKQGKSWLDVNKEAITKQAKTLSTKYYAENLRDGMDPRSAMKDAFTNSQRDARQNAWDSYVEKKVDFYGKMKSPMPKTVLKDK